MPDSSLVVRCAPDSTPLRSVVVVSGTALLREGILRVLTGSALGEVQFIGSLTQLMGLKADATETALVLVTLDCDDLDTIEMLAALHRSRPAAHIVVLADRYDADTLRQCLRAGADGFLLTTVARRTLLHALELVLLGEKVFPREVVGELLQSERMGGADPWSQPRHDDLTKLSEREHEILAALVAGESNKTIALRLSITEATVKIHLRSILKKSGARNRTQAAIWALKRGVRPRSPCVA